jgi:prepilin-type N-terminal cleavage/methylation domain-containing protein
MKNRGVVRTAPTPWRNLGGEPRDQLDGGFTLIELIIVALVLPIIMGAITLALVSIFSLQTSTSSRISNSSDAQVVSSNFESDVQSAALLIAPLTPSAPTGQSPATCGTGTEVLSLESGNPTGSVYPTEISYVIVRQGTSSVYSLVRDVCNAGSSTPVSTSTVSHNVASNQTASVTCASTLTSALASGTAYSLAVTALPDAVSTTDSIVVTNTAVTPATTQTFTAASSAPATTGLAISVNSQAATSTFPVGASVVDSSWAGNNCGAASGWISTVGVTGVTFAITEPTTGTGTDTYSYTLTALPRSSGPPNPQTTVAIPIATNCGFANAGTGTYASSLCFVDFTAYDPAKAYSATYASSPGCEEMAATIPGTSFTMSFCLSVWGGPVVAAAFPTWTNAFLGNTNPTTGQSFYTGVPGHPALYQSQQGTTSTAYLTGIQVTNSNGIPATGWNLVVGDAETTDAGESISWTANQTFSLLWNTPTSAMGNACGNMTTPPAGSLPAGFTGIGYTTVTCAATQSGFKTGTPMIEAPAPNTLTATMIGTGLEGMFIGLLLPSSS